MAMPRPDDQTTCHWTGHKEKCAAHYTTCGLWQQVEGQDQAGQTVKPWSCIDHLQLAGQAGVIKALMRVDKELSELRADIQAARRGSSGAAPVRGALPPAAREPARDLIEQATEKGGWG